MRRREGFYIFEDSVYQLTSLLTKLFFHKIGHNANISVEVAEASSFDPGWSVLISQISSKDFCPRSEAEGILW